MVSEQAWLLLCDTILYSVGIGILELSVLFNPLDLSAMQASWHCTGLLLSLQQRLDPERTGSSWLRLHDRAKICQIRPGSSPCCQVVKLT